MWQGSYYKLLGFYRCNQYRRRGASLLSGLLSSCNCSKAPERSATLHTVVAQLWSSIWQWFGAPWLANQPSADRSFPLNRACTQYHCASSNTAVTILTAMQCLQVTVYPQCLNFQNHSVKPKRIKWYATFSMSANVILCRRVHVLPVPLPTHSLIYSASAIISITSEGTTILSITSYQSTSLWNSGDLNKESSITFFSSYNSFNFFFFFVLENAVEKKWF